MQAHPPADRLTRNTEQFRGLNLGIAVQDRLDGFAPNILLGFRRERAKVASSHALSVSRPARNVKYILLRLAIIDTEEAGI